MTGVSLYGIVADIRSTQEPVFSVKIQDVTGAVWVRLHFDRSWQEDFSQIYKIMCYSLWSINVKKDILEPIKLYGFSLINQCEKRTLQKYILAGHQGDQDWGIVFTYLVWRALWGQEKGDF